jgi:hypothetical protein
VILADIVFIGNKEKGPLLNLKSQSDRLIKKKSIRQEQAFNVPTSG